MFFVLFYIFFLFGYALTSDHTPHVELARQGSYVNQLFSDEPIESFGMYTARTVCQIWTIYFTGLHIIKCMVKDK
jgi:hypothetical protein